MVFIRLMNLRNLDLNLILVLDALLRDRSTTLAGQRIGLSQPAVSQALRRLRHSLNDPLFVRHGQRLEPTDYATSLATPLRELLDRLEGLLSGPEEFDPSVLVENFRISGSDFFADMLMPQLIDRMAKEAPNVIIQMVDLVPDNYVETLESYEVDIALIPQMNHPEWIEWQPLFNSSFAVIARKGNPRLARHRIGPGEIIPMDLFCDFGHILFSPEGNLRAMGDTALARVGRQRKVVTTLPTFHGVCRATARSDHVALIPQQLGHFVASDLGLEIYEPPMPMPLPLIGMIWHKRSSRSPPHRWLRSIIAELMTPLNEGEPPLPTAKEG
jgi:DNA-binding transcriptional LysR family regulator